MTTYRPNTEVDAEEGRRRDNGFIKEHRQKKECRGSFPLHLNMPMTAC